MAVIRRALLAAALACAAAPAEAAPPADKSEAIAVGKQGDALFKAERYREALERYDEAWSLAPVPVLLWNRARCHEELDELAEAAALFEELAASDAPASRRKQAAHRAEALRARIAKPEQPPPDPQVPVPTEPVDTAHTAPPDTTIVKPGEQPLPGAPSSTLLRTNALMLIVVSPILELEQVVADHWSIEAGLAFGMPVSGRDFGLGGLIGARWYPLQQAPDGWFVEAVVLTGGALSGEASDTLGALIGVATGYQYLAWDTLALGIAAGPGVLATADGVIFFPALRADIGVAF